MTEGSNNLPAILIPSLLIPLVLFIGLAIWFYYRQKKKRQGTYEAGGQEAGQGDRNATVRQKSLNERAEEENGLPPKPARNRDRRVVILSTVEIDDPKSRLHRTTPGAPKYPSTPSSQSLKESESSAPSLTFSATDQDSRRATKNPLDNLSKVTRSRSVKGQPVESSSLGKKTHASTRGQGNADSQGHSIDSQPVRKTALSTLSE